MFGDVCDREVNVVSADVAYVGPLRRAAFGTTRGSGSATKASPRTKDNVYAPSDEVAVGLFCLSSHVQSRLCSSLRIVWTVAIRRAIQSRSGGRGGVLLRGNVSRFQGCVDLDGSETHAL